MIPPALRALPRPSQVVRCAGCAEPHPTNYPHCAHCSAVLDQYWQADWQALLAREQIQPGTADEVLLAHVVLGEVEQHPWSCVDWAMTLVQCDECGQELGGGPLDCMACATAFGNALWSELVAGRRGEVTSNEHALHVGRYVLRHPHRYPPTSVLGWRLNLPHILTGWLPSTAEAQAASKLLKAGRVDEVKALLHQLHSAAPQNDNS
jgi:hypothetical protein